MKKVLCMVVSVLLCAVFLYCCKGEEKETPKDSIPPVTENTTEAVEDNEKTICGDIEELCEYGGILSVKKCAYGELSAIDISSLNEEAREVYEGISETLTYQVMYEVDGCKVSAYISAPADYLDTYYPIVIYNRGGNGNIGANTAMTVATCSYYTKSLVVASNYREASPGTGKDQFGGEDVFDVAYLIEMTKSIGFADRDRVYMIGESRGGMQTCLALLQDTEGLVKGVCCVSGAYDLIDTYNNRSDMRKMLEERIGGSPENCKEEYLKRSAVTFADKIDIPILLIHSINDQRVSYSQVEEFAEELEKHGKEYELVTRNDSVHCISSPNEFCYIMEWFSEISN